MPKGVKQKIMIKIKLNDEAYRYDVYHMFNLFYSFTNIDFVDKDYDYEVDIIKNKLSIKGKDEKFRNFKINNEVNIKEQVRESVFRYLKDRTGKELPWGILIGIRPTKIALDMMDRGLSEDEIIKFFKNKRFVREDKAKLCIDVAKVEKEKVNKDSKTVSIYIGMPFCPTRCLYCSFASNPIRSCRNLVTPYLEALSYEIEEIKKFIEIKGLNIECVYFGGGTPTAINDEEFRSILCKIYESFVKGRAVKEFNVECGRPDSITEGKLKSMKEFNVNRISINPQTMNDDTLKAIGRNHTVQDIIDKFNLARELGFENINMDIIVGLPNEGLRHIEKTCSEILKLNPDSITVHGMSLKRASILHEQIFNKKLEMKQQDELIQMYEETAELAKRLDMKPYYMYRQKNMVGNMENVGYCKPNKEGLYNIEMIEDKQTIIALGADAVTKAVFLETNKIERFGNLKDVKEYTNRIKEKVEGKIRFLEALYE